MKSKLLASLLAVVSLSAQAAPSLEDVVTSPDTFAVCKTVDVVSTVYLLEHGLATEGNPVVAALISHGYIPLIAVSYGLWWWMTKTDNKPTKAVVNLATCGVAAQNLLLIP